MDTTAKIQLPQLPGLDCGVCGFRKCADLAERLENDPALIHRCIHLSRNRLDPAQTTSAPATPCAGQCATCATPQADVAHTNWVDSLGREFDFYLEHFPEDPGPREVIIPHNPLITRELDIKIGDTLIGRPLGMSCGCPITHCGYVVEVDHRTGVMTWCVTGPLGPREHGYKDLGYYIAEAYEGLALNTKTDLRIGMRYWFQPRMCMLQWRHSGLINYLNKIPNGYQVRIEGLYIG